MAGRYLLTGAQLSMIAGLAKSGKDESESILKLIDTIQKEQYLGESIDDIDYDVYCIQWKFLGLEKVENGCG